MACIMLGEKINAYRISMGNLEGRRYKGFLNINGKMV
jgi:hypothetical protein